MMMTKKEKKRVPELRFAGFEGEWEKKIIGSIGVFNGGGTPDSSNKSFWDGDIPWISSSDINEESIHEISKTRFITLDAIEKSATKVIPKGSVLMVSRVGIGKFAVADEDLCTSQDFTNLTTKENEYFIAYYFKARKNRFLRLSQGTSIKGFTTKDIKRAKFLIPTVKEQQKIASFLTSIDTRIQQLEKKKTLLEQYKKGVMQKIFSQEIRFKDDGGKEFGEWEKKRLGDVLDIQGGYAFKSKLFNGGNTKVLRIGDIDSNIRLDNFTGVYSKEIPDDRYIVKENDFLMALSGATFGKLGKIYGEGVGYINQRVATFRTDNCLEFFYQMMQTNKFKNYINSIPSASAQPNISNSDIIKYKAKLPCLAEQTKIAHFLSSLDRKIAVTDGQIERTKEWKKGLLQRMFV